MCGGTVRTKVNTSQVNSLVGAVNEGRGRAATSAVSLPFHSPRLKRGLRTRLLPASGVVHSSRADLPVDFSTPVAGSGQQRFGLFKTFLSDPKI
jgi:hypothetical protein